MTDLGDGLRAAVTGAGAVSAFGFHWHGLGQALLRSGIRPAPSAQLASSHPGTMSSEVPSAEPAEDPTDPKARKLMSRSAHLAAIAIGQALGDAEWTSGRELIGAYLGVGASGGPIEELEAILRGCASDGRLDLDRFSAQGLPASHPLHAFHLLNNYILCHGSIAFGLGGPNAAFYSRGAGTFTALREALWALREGTCDRALAGGADSALHIGTYVELTLEGFTSRGLVPGEGAALLALAREATRPLAYLEVGAPRRSEPSAALEAICSELARRPVDLVVLAAWGPSVCELLASFAARALPRARILDLTAGLGDSLAAAPALGCAAALDLLAAGEFRRALVLGAGVDGAVAGALLTCEAEA